MENFRELSCAVTAPDLNNPFLFVYVSNNDGISEEVIRGFEESNANNYFNGGHVYKSYNREVKKSSRQNNMTSLMAEARGDSDIVDARSPILFGLAGLPRNVGVAVFRYPKGLSALNLQITYVGICVADLDWNIPNRGETHWYDDQKRADSSDDRIIHYNSGPVRFLRRFSSSTRVFVSYVHDEQDVVIFVEQFVKLFPNIDLRWDYGALRPGDDWPKKLREEIKAADIFQLMWSRKAKLSINVEAEWRYALSLNRQRFIRPIYWQKPMPAPPQELLHIHFQYVPLPTATKSS